MISLVLLRRYGIPTKSTQPVCIGNQLHDRRAKALLLLSGTSGTSCTSSIFSWRTSLMCSKRYCNRLCRVNIRQ